MQFHLIIVQCKHFVFNCLFPYQPPLLFVSPRALLQADVVLLLGARLNWILHFGLPPRFDPDVKVIQVCEWASKMLLWSVYNQCCFWHLSKIMLRKPQSLHQSQLCVVCYRIDELLHCVPLLLQMLCSVCRLTFVLRRWGTMWDLLLLSWETSVLLSLRYMNCNSFRHKTLLSLMHLSPCGNILMHDETVQISDALFIFSSWHVSLKMAGSTPLIQSGGARWRTKLLLMQKYLRWV